MRASSPQAPKLAALPGSAGGGAARGGDRRTGPERLTPQYASHIALDVVRVATLVLLPLALLAAGSGPVFGQGGEPCPGGGYDPTPVAVPVTTVPIEVASTTDDYFVLYVTFDADGTELQVPVAVTRGEAGTTTLSENLTALPADRYRVEQYQVADPADVDGDCIDDLTELANLGSMNPVNPAMIADPNDGVVAVPDLAAFQAQGTGVYGGVILKFVVLHWDTARPAVYFMNTKLYPSHQSFFRSVDLEEEGAITGTLTFDPAFVVPGRGVGSFHCYFLPLVLDEGFLAHVEYVHTVLAASLGVIDDNLTLHVGNYLLHVQERLPQLRASRIPLVFDSDLYGDVEFLALNIGTGYGRLRILEAGERPHPRDIIVTATLPTELPRVAGILTAAPQTPLSHVNLRVVQDGIPNAYVKDVLDHADVTSLTGSYVRYEVADRWWELRAATLQEVEDHYEASRPAETQTPQRDLSITEITPLDDIGFDDWKAFGVKAANLAVLSTLGFPEGTVPDGFVIPFYFYDEFLQQPLGQETVFGKGSAPAEDKLTLAADTTLIEAVETILAHPKFQTDLDIQAEMLDDLRDAIKDAQTPQWMIDALTAMHATYPAGQSLRYRSSTNNEDLPGFNGAGLYDSKTQHPEETEEDGLDKSFKQVLAGLWTFRAFSEREFHRVDHLAAAMGVLVHPNFSDELVNGVAVTFDPVTARTDRYYVNSQLGEDLVTNPEAGSVPEEIVLLPGDGLSIRAFSNLVEPGELLMSGDQMQQLRGHLTTIRDHFEGLYNPAPGEPFAMEIEFKITSANILAIKQARPWVFGHTGQVSPPPPPPPPRQPSNTGGGGSSGGGSSSGGGGSGSGGSRVQDQHGNSPGQATRLSPSARAPWASSTPGQLSPVSDVDYFTLEVPHDGILVVETTGATDTVGTVWQAGGELATATGGGVGQNFHLSVPVQAGAVVIAVAGTGRTGSYRLETRLVVGFLENPGPASFQSGIGVLSGWVCAAAVVEVAINGTVYQAAYGTARRDTHDVCGDSATGFGVLFNWNLLGDGEHAVVALADGVEFARTTVTVTTLGAEFLRDVAGECLVADFPSVGESVRLVWQEAQQNFVLAEGAAPTGPTRSGTAGVGFLENPSANSFQSGIGVLSGWVCEAEEVVITLGDLAPQVAGYGTERLDTLDVCGDTDNGFGLLFNWNLLGDGEYVVVATVDGAELARTTVRVTTLGEEFVRGAVGECVVGDFPSVGETVTLTWQQTSQNFVITRVE